MTTTLIAPSAPLPQWAQKAVNLADPRLGCEAIACSDDFFAPMARMLNPSPATFVPGKYDENGKWMDGWESRRKRVAGYDWCIIKLGCTGKIAGFDLDTSFFTGNYPLAAMIEGCPAGEEPASCDWQAITGTVPLQGNQHHFVEVTDLTARSTAYSHLRINIYPDGGLARLRVYGTPSVTTPATSADGLVDLAAMANGGRAIAWNDAHFGAASNLLLPNRGINMGEGWETRRRREPGYDWCVIALGLPGKVVRLEVDTAHFKGNYPDRCSVQAAYVPTIDEGALPTMSQFWAPLINEQPLSADNIHTFNAIDLGNVTHLRLNLHPDGGVSRLRAWGAPLKESNA